MVLSPVQHRDYYEVLGVPRSAAPNTIKDAFHRLARRYHPDRSKEPEAEEHFKEITEAFSVLSDSGRRAAYDATEWPSASGRRAADLFGRPGRSRLFTFGRPQEDDRSNRGCATSESGDDPFQKGRDIHLEVE